MKKMICAIISLLILAGCYQQPIQKLEIQGIEQIQYEKLTQNLNSNVKFILYIGRDDCGDCEEFYPVLQDYVNKHDGTGIYYLNIKEFRNQAKDENASQEEKDFYDNLSKELHFDWTPTIHVISNGDFIKSYEYLDEDYYKIKDKEKREKKKQEFLDEFRMFMDDYFKEEA